MSKTPICDRWEYDSYSSGLVVPLNVAKDLENELAEARAEIESLKLSAGELNGAFNARPTCLKCREKDTLIERKDKLIAQMRQALGIGLESTRELLHEFDKKHGRTTPKNRLYTDRWEAQIKQMETALEAAERGEE